MVNQSLLDIAIQEGGNVLSVFDWALKNNISITQELLPGDELLLSDSLKNNKEVIQYFKGKNQTIASSNFPSTLPQKGIGHMKIASTFIVG